jgi:hypothetical protein
MAFESAARQLRRPVMSDTTPADALLRRGSDGTLRAGTDERGAPGFVLMFQHETDAVVPT